MRYLFFILALLGAPAMACENSDAFFASASDEELLTCIRENKNNFIASRDRDQSGVLHKIVKFKRLPDLIDALHTTAGAEWEKLRIYIDESGKTPLHYAAQYAVHPSVVSRLIFYGLEPDALKDEVSRKFKSDRGITPLHLAATRPRQAAIAAALIAGGADQTLAEPQQGFTPLMQAAALAKDTSVLAVLLADPGVSLTKKIGAGIVEKTDDGGNTALNIATNTNRPIAVIRMLVQAGSSVESPNKDGFTPLLSAAAYSTSPEVVLYLFEKSSSPCTTTEKTKTAEIMSALELLNGNEALSENMELKTKFHEKCNEGQ